MGGACGLEMPSVGVCVGDAELPGPGLLERGSDSGFGVGDGWGELAVSGGGEAEAEVGGGALMLAR